MPRAKSKFRKVFNARYLRWRGLGSIVRMFPPLGRFLGFFPEHVTMLEKADVVLADERQLVDPDDLAEDIEFLRLCKPHDTASPDIDLPNGIETGRRTALFKDAWIDTVTSSVLLPGEGKTVLVRGEVANWNATSARLFRTKVPVQGRVWMPLNTVNYFHALMENGIRLLDLLQSGVLNGSELTVAISPGLNKVQRAMFDGICAHHSNVSLLEVPHGALVQPEEALLHFPYDNNWEWPPVTRPLINRLIECFQSVYGPLPDVTPSDLYLTRTGAKLRDPANAKALEAALKDTGVRSFTASDQNHPEQIASFRTARTVIAVHGAGLTNLLFCKPDTRVIEIFPKNFVKSTYWNISRQMGLEYTPVICGPGDYHLRFEVDISAVLNALRPARAA